MPIGYVIAPAAMQPTRSANDTVEFRRNYGANEFVNALYALDNGYRGQGVTVGVIDDGLNTALTEFAGQVDTVNSMDFGYTTIGGVRTKRNELGNVQSDHGTPVAAIIAARSDGNGTMGYAPDAKIAVLRVDDYNADTQTETLTHAYDAINFAADRGIKVINMSLVANGDSGLGRALTNYASKAKGLLVQSAGNAGGPNPADAAAVNSTNINSIVFVVASNGSLFSNQFGLASYSNQAGTMMERTVTAPGTNVTTLVDGTVGSFSGTSSAAPVVAAIAADILSKWPQLTGQQAGDLLLNTARDIGAPGTDAIFGRGMVDVQRALSPVNPTLSNSMTQSSVDTSVMVLPEAFSMTQMRAVLSNVTVLDAYGRDFNGSIAGMVIKPNATLGSSLRRRVQQMGAGGQADLATGPFSGSVGFATEQVGPSQGQVRSTVTNGQIGVTVGNMRVRAGWNAQESLQNDVMGLAPFADGVLAYVPQAGNSFGIDRYLRVGKIGLTLSEGRSVGSVASAVTLGWSKGGTDVRVSFIAESGTIMGTPTGAGALRLGRGATTTMLEAHETVTLSDRWRVEGYGSLGVTRLKTDAASLVTGATPIIGSRLGIQMVGAMFGGNITFGIAQPLVIEAGSARLTYGSGYDLALQSLTYSTTNASLAGQRRVQLTAGFAREGRRSNFRVGVLQDISQQSTSALAGWAVRF